MPQAAVCNMRGENTGEIQLSDVIFGASVNHTLIHQALLNIAKELQRPSGRTRCRSEIRYTSAKMYRQKGTGRARHGSKKAGLMVGGFKAFGPRGVLAEVSMPRKMRRKALYSALSAQMADGLIKVIDGITLDGIRSKAVAQMLTDLGVSGNIMLLLGPDEAYDEVIYKSCRNIARLIARPVPHFSVREVLWADKIILTKSALAHLESGVEENAEC